MFVLRKERRSSRVLSFPMTFFMLSILCVAFIIACTSYSVSAVSNNNNNNNNNNQDDNKHTFVRQESEMHNLEVQQEQEQEQVRLLLTAGDKMMGQGRSHYTDALAKYTEALMRDPHNVRGLYSRAELHSLLKRYDDALHDLDHLLTLTPEHAEALRLRMSLNAQRGHLFKAVEDAEKFEKIHDKAKHTSKAKDVRATAEKLRQYALRWNSLRDILDKPISILLMTYNDGKSNGNNGKTNNNPNTEKSNKGNKNNKNNNAADDDNNKEEKDLASKRKQEIMRERRFEEAVRLLSHIITDFARNDVELRLKRAACALFSHNTEIASLDVRFVLERESQNLNAMVINAMALRHLGATKQAKDALHHCLSIDPENKLCARVFRLLRAQEKHFAEIQAQIQNKNYEQALSAIKNSLAVEPHPPFEEQLMEWRCEAYVGLRNVPTGLKACQEAIDHFSSTGASTSSSYSSSSSSSSSQTNTSNKHNINDAINPNVFILHMHMAELYLLDDRLDDANEQLQKAKSINANSQKVNEMEQKIANLRRTGSRKDYYKILGVPKTASAHDIRRAYRKLAKVHHPDQLRSKDLTPDERERQDKLFRDINEAKEVLLDEDKRVRYDNGEDVMRPAGQQAPQQPFFGQPFHFSFNGFPGGFGGKGFPGGFGGFPGGASSGQKFFKQTGPNGEQQFFFFQQG